MVLIDTSVWIHFLANRAPYAAGMDQLLSNGKVWGHDLVYGELFIADKGGRLKLLKEYEYFHQAKVVPHNEVVTFVRERKLHGRGAGWIDIHLLASALVGKLQLWTADSRLHEIARELGVAY